MFTKFVGMVDNTPNILNNFMIFMSDDHKS